MERSKVVNPGTKSIVITGTSSGIGRATAMRLARNGRRVFAAVRRLSDAESMALPQGAKLEPIRFRPDCRYSSTVLPEKLRDVVVQKMFGLYKPAH